MKAKTQVKAPLRLLPEPNKGQELMGVMLTAHGVAMVKAAGKHPDDMLRLVETWFRMGLRH